MKVAAGPQGWQLLRNGKPYFVQGACVWGENVRMDELAEAGANSARTYSTKHARWTLDAAQKRGLTVMVGFECMGEHHGWFSYSDQADLNKQRDRLRGFVRQFKNHPAVLAWAIGNEVEQNIDDPTHLPTMWAELNNLAKICKEIDPNHPTAIILAGVNEEKLAMVGKLCPDVDLVCINTYGSLKGLSDKLDKLNWQRPYIVTEFGAVGWWEAEKTSWGAPIEITSTQKARLYLDSYQHGVLKDKRRCLGSYVFFWDPKQEATATWFGMFLPTGERVGTIDAMTQAWSHKWPRNRSPEIKTLEFIGGKDHYLPGDTIQVKLAASDPNRDTLGASWRITEESPPFTPDNSYETVPRNINEHSIQPRPDGADFPAPKNPGGYRIFAFVYDGHGNAATGNLCFYVDPPASAPTPTPAAASGPTPATDLLPEAKPAPDPKPDPKPDPRPEPKPDPKPDPTPTKARGLSF